MDGVKINTRGIMNPELSVQVWLRQFIFWLMSTPVECEFRVVLKVRNSPDRVIGYATTKNQAYDLADCTRKYYSTSDDRVVVEVIQLRPTWVSLG